MACPTLKNKSYLCPLIVNPSGRKALPTLFDDNLHFKNQKQKKMNQNETASNKKNIPGTLEVRERASIADKQRSQAGPFVATHEEIQPPAALKGSWLDEPEPFLAYGGVWSPGERLAPGCGA